MPSKQITFTPNDGDGVSFVMVVDEKDFSKKRTTHELAAGPTDVAMQEYEMFKTTEQNTSLVPASHQEVLKTFGTTNGNKILEFLFDNGNMAGKVTM
jgi:hypothetical protein